MKVTLKNLTKRFSAVTAVDDFTATLNDGELISLLGPSGCGKSTLLNLLAGILPVTAGQILFDGVDVTRTPPEQRGIGLVFQNYALYPHMTVLENICFPLEIQRRPAAERVSRAGEIAALVHVETLLNRHPSELSGGQQQRVAIARALVKQPRLLLLDEPLSNLDARLRLEMREEIRRIQRKTGVTTIFVTHDQEEAMSISDHLALMKDGKMQQFDAPQTLYNDPANLFVVSFLGNPPVNILKDKGTLVRAIRPESMYISPEGTLEGSISSLYEIGKERIAQVTIDGQTARMFATDDDVETGRHVHIALKNKGVFLFDENTGARIR